MKRYALLLVAALLVTGVASAATCAGLPPAGPALMLFGGSSPSPAFSSASFSCGGLTFNNFVAIDAGSVSNPVVAVTNAEVTSSGTVNLSLNPNLSANQDVYLYFTVQGPLSGIGLTVGGNNATVIEKACSGAIVNLSGNFNPGNNCAPTGTSLLLGGQNAISATSGNSAAAAFTSTSQTTYIFKDIGTGAGGGLSTITQSFTPVPEPISFVLMGSGLLGLGLAHRRRRKA